jgi:hypothetical protein
MCVALKRLRLEDAVEAWVEGIRVVVPGIMQVPIRDFLPLALFLAASKYCPQVYSF